jgi:hypothetical protein
MAVLDELSLRRWAIVRLREIGGCEDINPQVANSQKRPLTEEEILQKMEELRLLLAERLAQVSKG